MQVSLTNVSAASVLLTAEASPETTVPIAHPVEYIKLSAADDAVTKAAERIKFIAIRNAAKVNGGFEEHMSRLGDLSLIEFDAVGEAGTDFQASIIATVFKRVRDMSYRYTAIKIEAHEEIKNIAVGTAERVPLLFTKQAQMEL